MALLAFVGCDKTGKSTLFRAVLKKTNKHICVDRFTACQFVYGNHHQRNDTPSISYLREVEYAMEEFAGFVYVEAHVEDIVARFKEHNETDIEINDIELIMSNYREYIYETRTLPVLHLNTSTGSIEECVNDIIRFGDWIDTGKGGEYDKIGPGRILF